MTYRCRKTPWRPPRERFAPKWRPYSPGRRLEVAVMEHARRRSFPELDWMSSVAPEKLVASTQADPRWAVTAAGL